MKPCKQLLRTDCCNFCRTPACDVFSKYNNLGVDIYCQSSLFTEYIQIRADISTCGFVSTVLSTHIRNNSTCLRCHSNHGLVYTTSCIVWISHCLYRPIPGHHLLYTLTTHNNHCSLFCSTVTTTVGF
jgi:hypothetical protein